MPAQTISIVKSLKFDGKMVAYNFNSLKFLKIKSKVPKLYPLKHTIHLESYVSNILYNYILYML